MANCEGRIKKFVDAEGTVFYKKLSCEGDCDDGSSCVWQKSTDHHGSTREWCGCTTTEPRGCHIVLYTPGAGVPGSKQEVVCAGICENGECKLVENIEAKGPEGVGSVLTCSCR